MSQIDDYCRRYLEQWDSAANVRRGHRFLVAPGSTCRDMLNPLMIPYLDHPLVVALGSDVRHFLIVQKCYDMLLLLADHETEMVVRACMDLASSDWSAVRSSPVRQALLSVAADESYHALVAEQDIEQLEQVSGIGLFPTAQQHEGVSAAAAALATARAGCDQETQSALGLFVIGLMENATTEELADMVRFADHDCPFFEINRQHLRDEARHRLLFRRLMLSGWAALDEDQRRAVGEAIPVALEGYMASMMCLDRPVHAARLRHLGLCEEQAEEVLGQARGVPPAEHNPLARNMRGCLAEIGLVEDPMLQHLFPKGCEREAVHQEAEACLH